MDPLISTKLRPSQSRPKLVARPRLADRLNPEAGRKLTLVSAPVRDRGTLLRGLDDEAVERIAALAGPSAELPPGQVEIRRLGGALSRAPETPNAISHGDAAFGMNLGMLVLPGHEEQVDESQRTPIDGLRPWDTGGTLPNYLGSGDTKPHRVQAAYSGADYERLVAIKATHDPRNLFRVNHNIPPSRGASADRVIDHRPRHPADSGEGAE